ncbi:pentatricopeptide repeat-containing protein At3g57430, chloroplastic-like isoform X1 [Cucurbita pepo subsp. pepo]|uniref:pentatricopeptide repeat-containing protein At3g57430, chloroplastic-like isoform X1 n=1 Tax=Cucurbita pepo subsp. pepo TaxID=3664 RepID=UPI000C9DA3F2|nr:pentatricopeptide repeat-containing protein At3g57430, chloroplastic-like isoform X1 [Cucurbita pepo subsp. pepo]XP_023512049.1 pentatricopeptide repeat-containing protein At3g57430, chloroplastic-like isoform X1 [Cucurbita pepo subsp. pepo]XP_023512050.1 pentatricopeptide repeat-containing protein At3g57430, chloroplastic-like isoform X1 [Cucurbita pepo subsp. pepo]
MEISATLSIHGRSPTPKQAINVSKDWNLIIKHQTKLKNDHAILSTYTQMESLGIAPDSATMPLVLKACGRLNAIEKGVRIHSCIRDSDLIRDVRVGTALVDFYSKCGLVGEASKVFDEMPERDLVSWNALISGYVGCSCYKEAVLLFMEMQKAGLTPNSRTVVPLLLACAEMLELRLGHEIHGYCLRNGLFDMDAHVGTALIGFYMRFDAAVSHRVFSLMEVRNVVSWNAMITGYLNIGDYTKALKLFSSMLTEGIKFDAVTMLLVIQACAESESLQLGMQLHQLAIKFNFVDDLFVLNALLNMYSDNGRLESSCALFNAVPTSDAALWNSMISAYIAFGFHAEAIALYIKMRLEGLKEDKRTVAIMLSLCEDLNDGSIWGRGLHAHAMKSGMELDVFLGNALLSMYVEHNQIDAAQKLFDKMRGLDVISWNTMILALAQSKFRAKAFQLFMTMCESEIKFNSYTMISLLALCKDGSDLVFGRSIHGFAIKNGLEINTSLNTSLTEMYINCSDEGSATNLFIRCPQRDLISWNSLISSYIKNDNAGKALLLFNHMISELEPNSVTIISILTSCTQLAHLPLGQCLHAYTTRRGESFELDASLANAFITMYARCGKMQYAEKIFNTLQARNIVSWNAMITGYGMHGRGHDATLAFAQMLDDGFKPNNISFVSVLSACSHSGLTKTGLQLFSSMVRDFGIAPQLAHYGCIVDLLGRGGHFAEAIALISSMPVEPDASIWRALLSSCQVKSNKKLVETIFRKLVELEPSNPGNFVLLSNVYAAAGLWSEVSQIRKWVRDKGLVKPPGTSWIVIGSQVHYFTATDVSHPQSEEIYENLNSLTSLIQDMG